MGAVEPIYHQAEGPGRPPVGVERMLRFNCLQQWFNLSDSAVEEALYDTRAIGRWVYLTKRVPDQRMPTEFAPVTSPGTDFRVET